MFKLGDRVIVVPELVANSSYRLYSGKSGKLIEQGATVNRGTTWNIKFDDGTVPHAKIGEWRLRKVTKLDKVLE